MIRGWIATLAALAAACSQDTQPLAVRNLDRPSDIAFACYGDYRVTGQAEPIVSAQPAQSCVLHAKGTPHASQEDLAGTPGLYGFVLQSSRGTVAVVQNADAPTAELPFVLDSDPLTPGKNAIPIGTLPVGLTADESGCFMLTASAATGELSVLEVTPALNAARGIGGDAAAHIDFFPIMARAEAKGDLQPIAAPPRNLSGRPIGEEEGEENIGVACPTDGPTGHVYVSYPSCHLVAAVKAADGTVDAAIHFAEDGTPTLLTGGVVPAECLSGSSEAAELLGPLDAGPPDAGTPDAGPDAEPPASGAPRPVAARVASDGRLYIASENSPVIAAIGLDETWLPTGEPVTVQLEGEIGITALAVSEPVDIGGDNGNPGGGGPFRFIYAVATDRTVRVVKIGIDGSTMQECDTQVDPRFIHDLAIDVDTTLSCFPVGDPDTPPRRPGATSPGIAMLGQEAPIDVAFATVDDDDLQAADAGGTPPEPTGLFQIGTFAYITSSRGTIYIANVDDDNYPDVEQVQNYNEGPLKDVSLPLALDHQLRDALSARDELAETCTDNRAGVGGPRLTGAVTRTAAGDEIGSEKQHLLPNVRQLQCEAEMVEEPVPVPELAFQAPVGARELAYPDWRAVRAESWNIVWEGLLSLDLNGGVPIDGPIVRSGIIEVDRAKEPGDDGYDPTDVSIVDSTSPFCQMGVEKFDTVQLVGCNADPDQPNPCGIEQTCYVHPDASSAVTTGVCLPNDDIDRLAPICREFLISHRQYSVADVRDRRITLVPRRRALRTSPLDGCSDDAQCEVMARLEASLAEPEVFDPTDTAQWPPSGHEWACTDDPTRPPGPNRCLMTCMTGDDCLDGDICLGARADGPNPRPGFCNEGPLPPQECVEAVQNYQVRASDAFVVVGSQSGYLHNWVRGPEVADKEIDAREYECVVREDAHPLIVGRIPLRPPECATGDENLAETPPPVAEAMTDISPNPCLVPSVAQFEEVTPLVQQGNECVAQEEVVGFRPGTTRAIRFQNPSLRMHLVDTETAGDAECNGDRGGGLPAFSALYRGWQITFGVTAAFTAQAVPSVLPRFPVRVVGAPDNRMWVVDQGDETASGGRLYRVTPYALSQTPFAIQ